MKVSEYAEKKNISKQAVYKQIKAGKLPSFKNADGEIEVKVESVDADSTEVDAELTGPLAKQLEHLNQTVNQLSTAFNEKDNQTEHFHQLRQHEVDTLQGQLQTKDQQISQLHEQIDHLTQLLAVQTKTTASLSEQLEASRLMIEDMRKPLPSFWQRFTGRTFKPPSHE